MEMGKGADIGLQAKDLGLTAEPKPSKEAEPLPPQGRDGYPVRAKAPYPWVPTWLGLHAK